jgi:hypothetical protein
VLPPAEEEKEVKTAIGAVRAKMARKEMFRGDGRPPVATAHLIVW